MIRGVPAKYVPLGPAWATNSVNTVAFRHHGIISTSRYQFAAFYQSPTQMIVVRRDLATDLIQRTEIVGSYNLMDAHNCISLGIDRAGYIHLSYDHHASALRYRRSLAPYDVSRWTDEQSTNGRYEGQVTYPTFIMPGNGPLLMLYREGVHDKGISRLKEFDEIAAAWSDIDPGITSGAAQAPWSSSAYWNHPAVGDDGRIHLSFTWRSALLGAEKRINNIDIDYAYSDDFGHSWFSSRGRQFRLPITQTTSETVFPVSPGSNLINQCSMTVDSRGLPHIAFYADDPDQIPQYQHLWFDGRNWRHEIVSQRRTGFILSGDGTLRIPISRPDILIDDLDRVYMIFRGDISDNRLMALRLLPPDYEFDPKDCRILWMSDLGFTETVLDRGRWRTDRILSMYIQKSDQPAHDREAPASFEPGYIVDWWLVRDWDRL
ncbi:MAG: BNR repeat-containing protein [Sphingomonadaceae bacterium]